MIPPPSSTGRSQCPLNLFRLLWIKYHINHVLMSWEDTYSRITANPAFGKENLQDAGNPGRFPVLPHLCLDTNWKIWCIPVQKTHLTSQKKTSGTTPEPKYPDSGLQLPFTLNALNVSIFSCNCKCFTWVYLDKNHLQETKHKRGGWGGRCV